MKTIFYCIFSLFFVSINAQVQVEYELGIENKNNEVLIVDGVSYILNIDSKNSTFYNNTDQSHKNFRKSKLAFAGKAFKNNSSTLGYVQDNLNGEMVLIADDKTGIWQITGDTKFIQEYKCYEAILSHKIFNARTGRYKNVKSRAWFTYEIPIKAGPSNYSGLPGLIMELNPYGSKFVFVVSKIDFQVPDLKIPEIPNLKILTEKELYDIFMKEK